MIETETDSVAPIVKTLTLSCSADHAFVVFTERIADWWPVADHSITGAEATVIIEGREGGRILEVDTSGGEHMWGEINTWSPVSRLAYSWHPGYDASAATHVEVTFESDGAGCVVTLVHSGWASDDAALASRDSYDAGWGRVLAEYVAAL